MIRPIVKDILFLQRKAEKASRKDASDGRDLLDTLTAHSDTCVQHDRQHEGHHCSEGRRPSPSHV